MRDQARVEWPTLTIWQFLFRVAPGFSGRAEKLGCPSSGGPLLPATLAQWLAWPWCSGASCPRVSVAAFLSPELVPYFSRPTSQTQDPGLIGTQKGGEEAGRWEEARPQAQGAASRGACTQDAPLPGRLAPRRQRQGGPGLCWPEGGRWQGAREVSMVAGRWVGPSPHTGHQVRLCPECG